MSESKINIWTVLGKITAVLSVIWVSTQLYNNYVKKEYVVTAIGNHSPFYLPGDLDVVIKNSLESVALRKYLDIGSEKLDRKISNKIQSKIKKMQTDIFSSEEQNFEFEISRISETVGETKTKYGMYWWFTVTNTGQKELEELVLELPFEGYFVASGTNFNKTGNFKNRIEIGDFAVKQQILVQVWQLNDYSINFAVDQNIEQSRLTHKSGWQKIDYPVQMTGIVAWNENNDNFPLYLTVLIMMISYVFVFSLGEKYGPQIKQWDRKMKLEELKKLKELEQEEIELQKADSNTEKK
ncbi:hypothetical protein ACFQ21_13275 [Ohtaekwangia kribbensis]|uniref:DUF916 domain-containing protein n=1 Tax=Ohtaekwangia kribbensis TaxID=688913 RepID=A0ABW3K4Y5_9BACT